MLKHLIGVGCIFICTITIGLTSSRTTKSSSHARKSQHEENATKEKDFWETELLTTEFPSFSNRTSLNMLGDITAKVWRILPVIEIPRNWVLAYCTRYTEIYEDVEKAAMQCQYDGPDWDCVFIELYLLLISSRFGIRNELMECKEYVSEGGGRDDFNMGKIVSSFHDLSDRSLRLNLLRAAEICGKLWQRYKQVQEKRLTRMRLNAHVKSRKKRFSRKKNRNLRSSRNIRKNSRKQEVKRDEELKKARRAAKEVKDIRRSLMNRIRELENKRSLSSREETELDQLHLTMASKPRVNLEEYPITEDRTELSRLQEIGSCLSRQAAKACESFILNAVQKLI